MNPMAACSCPSLTQALAELRDQDTVSTWFDVGHTIVGVLWFLWALWQFLVQRRAERRFGRGVYYRPGVEQATLTEETAHRVRYVGDLYKIKFFSF